MTAPLGFGEEEKKRDMNVLLYLTKNSIAEVSIVLLSKANEL